MIEQHNSFLSIFAQEIFKSYQFIATQKKIMIMTPKLINYKIWRPPVQLTK